MRGPGGGVLCHCTISLIIRLWHGQPENFGSTPDTVMDFIRPSRYPYRLWGPPKVAGRFFTREQSSWVVSLTFTPHAQGQFSFIFNPFHGNYICASRSKRLGACRLREVAAIQKPESFLRFFFCSKTYLKRYIGVIETCL